MAGGTLDFRCNIFTYDLRICVCSLISVCYCVFDAMCKILGVRVWGLHFYKETDKIYKKAFILEILAYLYFVVWLNGLQLEVKLQLS